MSVSFGMKHNVGVDRAARIHSSIAEPVMMRNTLPPLASNDLLGGKDDNHQSMWRIS
jgi:hypothetical protein